MLRRTVLCWFPSSMLKRLPASVQHLKYVVCTLYFKIPPHSFPTPPPYNTAPVITPHPNRPVFDPLFYCIKTHTTLKERILAPLKAAMPVDGVLLDLHGGYSVQGLDDGDGDVVKAVREIVGPSVPINVVRRRSTRSAPRWSSQTFFILTCAQY